MLDLGGDSALLTAGFLLAEGVDSTNHLGRNGGSLIRMKMKCRFHLLATIGTQMVRMEIHRLRVDMRRANTSRGLGTVGSTDLTMIF